MCINILYIIYFFLLAYKIARGYISIKIKTRRGLVVLKNMHVDIKKMLPELTPDIYTIKDSILRNKFYYYTVIA